MPTIFLFRAFCGSLLSATAAVEQCRLDGGSSVSLFSDTSSVSEEDGFTGSEDIRAEEPGASSAGVLDAGGLATTFASTSLSPVLEGVVVGAGGSGPTSSSAASL